MLGVRRESREEGEVNKKKWEETVERGKEGKVAQEEDPSPSTRLQTKKWLMIK